MQKVFKMRKLINPYAKLEGFNCFGCAADNQHGLQMEFYEDGEEIISFIEPKKFQQGYFNVLHGGLQATILDEIASYIVYMKVKTGGVTSKLEIKYKKPVFVNQGKIKATARLLEVTKRLATIKAELYNHDGELGAEAIVQYFIYPLETAKEKLFYPGYEAFYE